MSSQIIEERNVAGCEYLVTAQGQAVAVFAAQGPLGPPLSPKGASCASSFMRWLRRLAKLQVHSICALLLDVN